jgi:hypothetical protein
LDGGERRKRQFLDICDRPQMAGEMLARFSRGPSPENCDVSSARKDFAIGPHQ